MHHGHIVYRKSRFEEVVSLILLLFVAQALPAFSATSSIARAAESPASSSVISLDGDSWLLAPDPKNIGRQEKWWEAPQPHAKPTKVPWVIQAVFPNYHGVAWYWRDLVVPANPHSGGRTLLRFWAVDYLADVWVNGKYVGGHEDGESPFVLDITDVVKPGQSNRVAVRVLNPTYEPIDGIALMETAHRNKIYPYTPGSDYNHGGIEDSVELIVAPPVRVEDLFVRADPKSGAIRIRANIRNASKDTVQGKLLVSVAPANSGETIVSRQLAREIPPGDTLVEKELTVANPRLWQLNDPYLYRVTARVQAQGKSSFDEDSVRCGYRDFRFEKGYFRLNGRRIFLKSSHTGGDCPIGVHVPHDPGLLRKDLLYLKTMGFNMVRFIAGVGRRYQLDLADEIGLLIYEEAYGSWVMGHSPKMPQRYDASILGMVRRDRNHPSVAIWGLLNETTSQPLLNHAAAMLPKLRPLDDTRVVFFNSSSFHLNQQV
ncbi:MAG: hypothetical protein JXM70_01135, partial [Pirellulales bacterium]|nr:hypothetical protein [Pirellulales bacterium]